MSRARWTQTLRGTGVLHVGRSSWRAHAAATCAAPWLKARQQPAMVAHDLKESAEESALRRMAIYSSTRKAEGRGNKLRSTD